MFRKETLRGFRISSFTGLIWEPLDLYDQQNKTNMNINNYKRGSLACGARLADTLYPQNHPAGDWSYSIYPILIICLI